MRCPRCNIAIPNGSEVCPECGCHVCAGESPAAQKPKRSWFQRIISVLAVIAIVAAARYVGEKAGEKVSRSMQEPDSSPQIAVQETVNPAFEAYLSQRGVTYECKLQESECFIQEVGGDDYFAVRAGLKDGSFEVLEYGYTGDRLTESYDTAYLSIEGYSADEVEKFKSHVRELVSTLVHPQHTSVDEEVQGDYLVIQIHWKNLDDTEVIRELVEDGFFHEDLLQGETVHFLSLEQTREELLEKGCIQR